MRWLLALLLSVFLVACADYEVKNLAKSDVDLVADEFIAESRRLVLDLMVKLYKRNPAELRKIPGLTVEGRMAQLRTLGLGLLLHLGLDLFEVLGRNAVSEIHVVPGLRS